MYWIIPANLDLYDLAGAFEKHSYIDWLNSRNFGFKKDDIIFIYCSGDYKKIMYKTMVLKTNLDLRDTLNDTEFNLVPEDIEEERGAKYTRLKFIKHVNTEELHLNKLRENGLKSHIQGPIRCNDSLAEYIDKHFDDHLSENYFNDIEEEDIFYEGAVKSVLVNKYERSLIARQECIKYHGYNCSICKMNFEKTYGEIGREFIHIHHKVPLHEIKAEYIVNPKNDLIPVCPNCHAMLHRKFNGNSLSIEELKELYDSHNRE